MSLPFLLWLTVVALGWFGHAPPELLLDLELHHAGHGLAPVPQGLDHDGQPQLVWTTPGGHSLFHVLGTPPTACGHNLMFFMLWPCLLLLVMMAPNFNCPPLSLVMTSTSTGSS